MREEKAKSQSGNPDLEKTAKYGEYFGPNSVESRLIAETRFNAKKLYSSAETLFEAEQWGAAISLSILSCEEAGKFLLLMENLGTDIETLRHLKWHGTKQEAFSSYLHACLRVKALDEHLLEGGENDEKARWLAAVNFLLACVEVEVRDPGGVAKFPVLKAVSDAIDSRIRTDPAFAVAELATAGRLDAVKQQGFYVDVKNGEILSPNQFGKEQAAVYTRAASLVVDSIANDEIFKDKPVPLSHHRSVITSDEIVPVDIDEFLSKLLAGFKAP